jgi:uncharacterized membrane protein
MEGVEEVRQVGDQHLRWRVNIGGKEKEFDTEITEQIPGKCIAWRSIGGTDNGGVVTFHHLNNTTSHIMVQIGYEPEGLVEKAGDLLALHHTASKAISSALKNHLERSGTESAIDTATSKTRPAKAIN